MRITVSRHAGLCPGASRAAETALSMTDSGKTFTTGDLVHNAAVVSRLKERGAVPAYDLSQLKKGDRVLICSHGIPLKDEESLRSRGVILSDATCPFVKKMQEIVREYYEKGYKIIIIGNKEHAEIKSVNGYADGTAQMIADPAEADFSAGDRFAAVCQTTFPPERYEETKKALENRLPAGKTVVFFNTICYTTKVRQEEARALASANDAVFVVGDRTSANARRLCEIASERCENVFLIEDVRDLESVPFAEFDTAAVLSAASTPTESVEEVLSHMSETQEIKVPESVIGNAASEEKSEEATAAVAETIVEESKDQPNEAKPADAAATEQHEAETSAAKSEPPEPEHTETPSEPETESEDRAEKADAEDHAEGSEEEKTEEHAETPDEAGEDAEKAVEKADESEEAGKPAEDAKPDENAEEAGKPEKKSPDEITMEDVVKSNRGYTQYHVGKRYRATISAITDNGIYVEIGGKKSGFIEKDEINIDRSYNPADFKLKDYVDAIILKVDQDYVRLSKREVDLIKKSDEEAMALFESPEFTVEPPLRIVTNKQGNPAGLEGRLNAFKVFIPASQIRMGRVQNLEEYLNKNLRLRMLERNGRRITASQRVILEEEKAAREEAFWEMMIPGAEVKGKVKRFASFGAFVGVKGYDCLAHISDLSWKKINDPSEVLELNKTYSFLVLKADRETGKISLGYKQLQRKPYEIAAEKYPVGSIVKGTIARIHPFGAFVQIEDGIDGLIHISQISRSKFVKDITDILHEGQEVEAKVLSFNDNRITLSMKELEPAPEKLSRRNNKSDFDEIAAEVENAPRSPRARNLKKFSYNPDAPAGGRRDRRDEHPDELRQWVSDTGNATLADLLKDIDFKFDDEAAADAEAPAEKPADEAAEKPKAAKKTKKTEKKAEESAEAPAEEPVEAPAEKAEEKPEE